MVRRMDQQTIIDEIEQRAFELRVSIRFVCQRAGVHPTTFSRWKKSPNNPDPIAPNFTTVSKLYGALRSIAAEQARTQMMRQERLSA